MWTMLAIVSLLVVVVRRRAMLYLLWPLFIAYPYNYFRMQMPFFVLGLQDILMGAFGILIVLVDGRALAEGFRKLNRTGRLFLFVWIMFLILEVLARSFFIIRHPQESPTLILRILVDMALRFVPAMMVLTYVRTTRDGKIVLASFLVAMALAFGLVIGDRYSPFVYDLFQRSAFGTSWLDHQHRAIGGFSGPWEVGVVGAAVFAFIGGLVGRKPGVSWPVGLFMFVLVVVGVSLSLSRGGILSLVFAFVPYLIFGTNVQRIRGLVVISIVVFSLSVLTLANSGGISVADVVMNRMSRAISEQGLQSTAGGRVLIWRDLADLLTTNRLSWSELALGVGGMLGAGKEFAKSAHSGYLGPIIYFGMIGGGLLLFSLGMTVFSALRDAVSGRRIVVLSVLLTSLVNMVGNEFLTGERYIGFCILLLSMTKVAADVTAPAVPVQPVVPPAVSLPVRTRV
jgi:hypothetical protein